MNKLKFLSWFVLTVFSATAMWADDPMGSIDGLTGKNGSFRIWGWALDPDAEDSYAVTIHVYLFDNATETDLGKAKKGINAGSASISRPDLASIGHGTMHGFDVNLSVTDLNPGTYYVRAYALDKQGVNNPMLGYSAGGEVQAATIGSPYTVSYDANGGSGAPTAQKKGADVTLKLSSTKPTRNGYTFSKWNTVKGGTGTNYNAGANYTANANATLYAQWTANTYKVTLDQQNGTGGSASVTATYGSAMPSATMPARTGYTFGGYYDQKNGAGTQYYNANGGSAKNWDKTAATTLYAKWTANQYTITFDRCGGTGGTESATATYDADLPAITLPTRTGHTFAGYFNESAGKGTKYYNADGTGAMKYNKAADTKVYANWTVNQYTITFDSKGGSAVEPITQNYGTAVIAPADPTREGYTFAGWEPALPETMPADNMTVAAKWNAISYTISYELNGGSVSGNPANYTIETATFTLNNPTREGYTFAGWTGSNGSTAQTSVSVAQGSTGDKTFTANWTVNQYTITFDSKGGSAVEPMTQDYGTAVIAPADPTREGYTFAGWEPALPETMPAENMTVVAQWNEIPVYAVALKEGTANADKVTIEPASAKENENVVVTPVEGYEIKAFKAYYEVVEDQVGATYDIDATLNSETGAYSFAMPAHDVIIEATIAKIPAACGLVWLGVPEGGVVGTIGHEDEVQLPQLYSTNPDFINALMGGSVTVRLGSTDESVLKVNGFNDFQVIAAGECDVYVVHDADANFAYDSAAFHVTIKEAAIPLVANEGVILRDYTKEAGWWQMTAQVGMYAISISPDADALAGTYDVQNLDPQYNGIYDFTADQQNPVKISFVSGSFTVVVDAEAHSVTVAGEIACSDGKTYAITLLYVQPEAKATVELNYADATLSDHIADAGQFQIAGIDMENQTMASFVIYSSAVVGEYTEADLNPNYSYIYAGGAQQTIYSATLKVEEFEGGHKLTGDVLCYNNTLYKVTLVVPATETGIEDVQLSGKAVKAFRDGQVVIIRDGKIYNIGGAQVK